MELLKERIRQQGIVLTSDVLKLDAILNHQVDTELIMEMGKEFARRFKEEGVTKVVTVESSGITIAFATAYEMKVPLIFARRKKTLTTDNDCWLERVPSFTKGIVTDIMISKQFLTKDDRVLIIDDFIANGDAARGLIRIIGHSGAALVGVGIAVEKAFQLGAPSIRETGIRVDSLARILRMEPGFIELE
ncbi:xanthine phosphoribosyltransferase [Gorillibacterium massiliense]|uniref:xanthine phosphoribosyltransferase n=1 Tax=Gorillibacterium massiliense TaxID=1280390 RepID=UPI0004B40447|nr:xanthine phosphoribosyltransferase [Gorillibacterium massiliense]